MFLISEKNICMRASEKLFAAELYDICFCFNYEEYLYLTETKSIAEELPGEKNLTGSDITLTVKSASSEQEQKCKY